MSTKQISEKIIQDAKEYIQRKSSDLEGLQSFWKELQEYEFEVPPDWPYVFQKLYLTACTYGHKDVANWLQELYEKNTDPVSKIAYKHTFVYGKYLLSKVKEK